MGGLRPALTTLVLFRRTRKALSTKLRTALDKPFHISAARPELPAPPKGALSGSLANCQGRLRARALEHRGTRFGPAIVAGTPAPPTYD